MGMLPFSAFSLVLFFFYVYIHLNSSYLHISCFLYIQLCYFCRYCAAGTVGHKLSSGKPTKIYTDPDTQIDVRCQVLLIAYLLFTWKFIEIGAKKNFPDQCVCN
jgi:hypothetical protein